MGLFCKMERFGDTLDFAPVIGTQVITHQRFKLLLNTVFLNDRQRFGVWYFYTLHAHGKTFFYPCGILKTWPI
jgi:hypothetical protein